jgi:hypothetical protein
MTAPPECPTCTPHWMISPSGGGWFHRRPCPQAGEKILGETLARALHPARGRRRLEAIESGHVRPIPLRAAPGATECPAHPGQDVDNCQVCHDWAKGA